MVHYPSRYTAFHVDCAVSSHWILSDWRTGSHSEKWARADRLCWRLETWHSSHLASAWIEQRSNQQCSRLTAMGKCVGVLGHSSNSYWIVGHLMWITIWLSFRENRSSLEDSFRCLLWICSHRIRFCIDDTVVSWRLLNYLVYRNDS